MYLLCEQCNVRKFACVVISGSQIVSLIKITNKCQHTFASTHTNTSRFTRIQPKISLYINNPLTLSLHKLPSHPFVLSVNTKERMTKKEKLHSYLASFLQNWNFKKIDFIYTIGHPSLSTVKEYSVLSFHEATKINVSVQHQPR